MYREYSAMSASSRKSASRAAQSRLESLQYGSENGSILYERTAKQIGNRVKEYCRNTLSKLRQTEEMVNTLEHLGTNIGLINDETKVLDCAKNIYETIADTQKMLDTTKIETRQLGITVDDLMSTMKSEGNPNVKALDDKDFMVTYVSDLNISHEKDGYLAYHIYSTQALEDGSVIVADFWNQTIKLLDSSQNVLNALKCRGCPWGLCKIKKNEYAVTLTDAQRIQILTVDDHTIKVQRDIQVDQPCRGLFYHKDNFYVACAGIGNEGPGHVRVVAMDGKRKVINDNTGKQLFTRPRQIFVNSASDEVFVTDADDVKVLDLQGNEIRRIKNDKLKSPYGICDDGRGNVLISGFMSNNVLRLDKRGKRIKEVIEKDQVINPVSLFLHPKTAMLFVGMERNKHIKLFSTER
ncbi:uncharacterized protein LOC132731024 [Ruditapes philippinarum]|uniref:uncharacterized protein LOC132731024 n=1 Tax=Ruditapes philippinarum TaxID=129788 RepID=UPI00295B6D69|nr:uncharacterized protein LOC132731024 [Ruditapes philippinarum]